MYKDAEEKYRDKMIALRVRNSTRGFFPRAGDFCAKTTNDPLKNSASGAYT